MASNVVILPDDVAISLKCCLCGGYLSVGPVRSSVDGTQYQCGRCDFASSHMNVRNYTYEKVATYLVFPCIYKGCNEKISWGEVKMHELNCQFRTFCCIIDSCYVDDLNTETVFTHFQECHPEAIMNANAILPTSPNSKLCFSGLLFISGIPYFFIVYISKQGTPSEMIDFNVLALSDSSTKPTYTITFYSNFNKSKMVAAGEKVEFYNEREHCVRCYLRECDIPFHKYSKSVSSTNHKPTNCFELLPIITFLQSSTIYYHFNIESDSQFANEKTNLIRKTVECPICKDYMQAPIYSCRTGHILCKLCKYRLSSCPSCQAEITTTRNFTLEELCESIKLPCENRGCNVVDSLQNLQIHESSCRIINNLLDVTPVAPQRKSYRRKHFRE